LVRQSRLAAIAPLSIDKIKMRSDLIRALQLFSIVDARQNSYNQEIKRDRLARRNDCFDPIC
jgi:hypothetical protein